MIADSGASLARSLPRTGWSLGGYTARQTWFTAGLVACVLVGAAASARPDVIKVHRVSNRDRARIETYQYTNEAYRAFRIASPDRACPTGLDELNAWMNKKTVSDPWGTPYVMTCDATTFRVGSAGEDTTLGTADDVWSDTP